ncbi:hypothetical protein Nepgr_028053 [Nepenthes gracilis]|uniref:Uncharacterized protein n=1 Tax=Nepenthes gracilis TaxID=150966 RepID=A0AAD3T9L4_NEPGR|nr:hypothetical protein Nepgr_028053 [Nepenthes gracilis]
MFPLLIFSTRERRHLRPAGVSAVRDNRSLRRGYETPSVPGIELLSCYGVVSNPKTDSATAGRDSNGSREAMAILNV